MGVRARAPARACVPLEDFSMSPGVDLFGVGWSARHSPDAQRFESRGHPEACPLQRRPRQVKRLASTSMGARPLPLHTLLKLLCLQGGW